MRSPQLKVLMSILHLKNGRPKQKNKAPSNVFVGDQWSNEYARYVETVLNPLQAEARLFKSRVPKQIRDLVESGLTTEKTNKNKAFRVYKTGV